MWHTILCYSGLFGPTSEAFCITGGIELDGNADAHKSTVSLFKSQLKRYFMGEGYPKFWIAKVRERGEVHRDALRILLDSLDLAQTERFLDLGAGEGSVSLEIRRRGSTYVGIDISRTVLLSAHELIRKKGIESNNSELIEGDAESLPFKDESFSRVGSFASFFFFPNQHRAMHELARVCQPGALIAIEHRNLLAPAIIMSKLKFWVRSLTAIAVGCLESTRIPLGGSVATLIERGARILYGFEMAVQPFFPRSLPSLLAVLVSNEFRIVRCYGYTIDYNRRPVIVQGIRSALSPGVIVVARKRVIPAINQPRREISANRVIRKHRRANHKGRFR